MTLKLLKKDVYGRLLYYPQCDVSKSLFRAFGCKTISQAQFELLKKTGWTIEVSRD